MQKTQNISKNKSELGTYLVWAIPNKIVEGVLAVSDKIVEEVLAIKNELRNISSFNQSYDRY